jgi:anthranilate phosphoribosyltransferase
MILVIDNYDSFIYNIVQYIGEFYSDIKVFRNDAVSVDEALALLPDGIVISPGPGRPDDAGISLELIERAGDIPLFGVCLGHQSIAQAFGGKIIQAKNIMHGKTSAMHHNGEGIFEGVVNPLNGIRYHSLVAERESFPSELETTARSDDGEIMGLRVKGRDTYGIQFHPESFLTEDGKKIIRNFVDIVVKNKTGKISGKVRGFISKISEGENLSKDEASEVMDAIMGGYASPAQIASYLMALKLKGETAEEIAGSACSMFLSANRVESDLSPIADTCGTGGDHSGTFNISTASAFVAAGAGVYIAKHGNRSITSKSGSADVLEKLGVNIKLSADEAARSLAENRFAFMFAPLYHPAMKNVMPVRREMGVRTIFNILGPIVNPAGVKYHVMGVFSQSLLDLIAGVFLRLGHRHSLVVHGEGGLDEATIEGKTFAREIIDGDVRSLEIDAGEFGLSGSLDNLRVSDADESAALIRAVLSGEEKGDPRKAVVLNSALVIYCALGVDLREAMERASSSIDDGSAFDVLKRVGGVLQ